MRPLRSAFSLIPTLAVPFVLVYGQRAPLAPKYTKVLELDSVDIAGPALSPDGRWIAYWGGRESERARNIWIIPASGGNPVRLTSGDYVDRNVQWFPKGDRIAFRSSRVDGALMTMDIDPATGRASRPPQRLTLEPAFAYGISEDGKWLAYSSNSLLPIANNAGLLRLIPATGGTARTLDSSTVVGDGFVAPSFTKDGRFIEYIAGHVNAPEELMRVAVSGGRPTLIRRGPSETALNGRPGLVLLARNGIVAAYRPAMADSVRLETFGGDPLGVIALRDMRGPSFQSMPARSAANSMVAVTLGGSSEVHVLSIDGGMPRVLRKGSPSDYIGGFLVDGRPIVTSANGGHRAIDIMPLGTGMPQHTVQPDSVQFVSMTTDGKFVYWRKGTTAGVFDVASGSSRAISTSFVHFGWDYTWVLGSRDEVPYVERAGDRFELRAWSPVTSTSRVLRSIGSPAKSVGSYSLRGDLVSYTVAQGDSTFVFVAANPSVAAQRLAAVRGHDDGLSISRDGRHIAFGIQMINGKDSTHAIGFVDLKADGSPGAPVRFVPVGNLSGVTWLPNGKEVVYESISSTHPQTSMVRLSAEEGARPQVISTNEKLPFWDFSVSPDGKWVSTPPTFQFARRSGASTSPVCRATREMSGGALQTLAS